MTQRFSNQKKKKKKKRAKFVLQEMLGKSSGQQYVGSPEVHTLRVVNRLLEQNFGHTLEFVSNLFRHVV